MRQISLKRFVQVNQRVEEVSKQLTGWQKSQLKVHKVYKVHKVCGVCGVRRVGSVEIERFEDIIAWQKAKDLSVRT